MEIDNIKVFFKVNKVEDIIGGTIKKITKGFFIPPVKNSKRLIEKDRKIKKMLNLLLLIHLF